MEQNTQQADIVVLQHDVTRHGLLFEKLETAIERMGDATSTISQMLAVHELKINKTDEAKDELFTLVDRRRTETASEIKELQTKLSDTERRIMQALDRGLTDIKNMIDQEHKIIETREHQIERRVALLEKWRLIVVGGALVLGALWTYFAPIILQNRATPQTIEGKKIP